MKLATKTPGKFSLLATDPGYTNFGWSQIDVVRGQARVIECGLLTGMITDLKEELTPQKEAFSKSWRALHKRCAPDTVVAERYMSQRQGLSNELVNYMLGAMWYTATTPFVVYNAATWKARIKKLLGGEKDAIDQFYKEVGTTGELGVKDHAIDATLNGLYFLERDCSVNISKHFANDKAIAKLASQIRDAYVGYFPFK